MNPDPEGESQLIAFNFKPQKGPNRELPISTKSNGLSNKRYIIYLLIISNLVGNQIRETPTSCSSLGFDRNQASGSRDVESSSGVSQTHDNSFVSLKQISQDKMKGAQITRKVLRGRVNGNRNKIRDLYGDKLRVFK